ncbi:MAG: hypothetical protein GY772_31370, partial [bacterium]|nr:hypothetical protein [bacterium]
MSRGGLAAEEKFETGVWGLVPGARGRGMSRWGPGGQGNVESGGRGSVEGLREGGGGRVETVEENVEVGGRGSVEGLGFGAVEEMSRWGPGGRGSVEGGRGHVEMGAWWSRRCRDGSGVGGRGSVEGPREGGGGSVEDGDLAVEEMSRWAVEEASRAWGLGRSRKC